MNTEHSTLGKEQIDRLVEGSSGGVDGALLDVRVSHGVDPLTIVQGLASVRVINFHWRHDVGPERWITTGNGITLNERNESLAQNEFIYEFDL